MPIDPWATTTAQEFTAQEPDFLRRLWQIIAAQKRAMFDIRASVLANVSDIVADLRAQVAATAAATAAVAAAQITLTAAVADLASRVSVTTSIPTFNTGALPNDNTWRNYGADIPITIAVPTGKLSVTVGCGMAYMLPMTGSNTATEATFSISGGIANYGDVYAIGFAQAPTTVIGMSLCVQQAFTVPPGTYTITGKMRAKASGGTPTGAEFDNPYLTVQVTG